MKAPQIFLFVVMLWCAVVHAGNSLANEVIISRAPENGLQPQVLMDSAGTIHLIYFKGEAKAGNVFYVRCEKDGKQFSDPIQVNSQARTAMAIGTIRGPQLALGRGGRVHVAWNGTGATKAH